MDRDDLTTLGGVAGSALVFSAVLAFVVSVPAWLSIGAAIVLTVIAFLALRHVRRRREQDRMRQQFHEHAPVQRPDPPEPEQVALTDVPLRSAVDGYRFLLSGTVLWQPTVKPPGIPHGNPAALARDAVLTRAGEITAVANPEECTIVETRLNALLGTRLADGTGHVDVWAHELTVALPEPDRARLQRLSEARKEQEVWAHERARERTVREYLGEDVLTDLASAVVWYLARNIDDPDVVQRTVREIGNLETLTATAGQGDPAVRKRSGYSANGSVAIREDGTPRVARQGEA